MCCFSFSGGATPESCPRWVLATSAIHRRPYKRVGMRWHLASSWGAHGLHLHLKLPRPARHQAPPLLRRVTEAGVGATLVSDVELNGLFPFVCQAQHDVQPAAVSFDMPLEGRVEPALRRGKLGRLRQRRRGTELQFVAVKVVAGCDVEDDFDFVLAPP